LSYDHTALLGHSLASIAAEKGGIIKPGVPVVSAPQPPEALEVLEETAAGRHAPMTLVGHDWFYLHDTSALNGTDFRAAPAGYPLESYHTALIGEHQALNATVALAALHHARETGLNIPPESIRAGFERVDWPGRLEVINRSPLLVLDAAHNGASARHLAAALDDLFPQRPLALIFGVSADKDVAGMFDALLPLVDYLITAQAVHPRALAPDEIATIARQQGYTGLVEQIPDAEAALQRASDRVGPGGLVCVTGSLFLVGELRTVCGLPVGHVARQFNSSARMMSGKAVGG
jgi:dihydrofolate synthase/folylpolyglutamate synthase